MFKALTDALTAVIKKLWYSMGDVFNTTTPSSFGRFASFLCLLFVLGWNSCYVYTAIRLIQRDKASIRDILPDPGQWVAETGFMLAFYTASKSIDAYSQGKQNGNQNGNQP